MDLLDRYILETHQWAKSYIYDRFAVDIYDLPFLPKVDISVTYGMLYDGYYELKFVYHTKDEGKRMLHFDILNSIMFIHFLYHLEVISESDFYSFMEADSEDFDKFLLENKHMNFIIENQYYALEEEKIEVSINVQ